MKIMAKEEINTINALLLSHIGVIKAQWKY